MAKSNAVSMLAAGRLIARRLARACLPREGSLREDLREDAYRGKAHRAKICERVFAARRLIVQRFARGRISREGVLREGSS